MIDPPRTTWKGGGTALLCFCLLSPGCRERSASSAPVRIAHEAPLISLDPVAASDSIAKSVLSNFYDALVDHDAQMRPIPDLALSWSSPDERTWILPLRTDVLAHDGGVLTPRDVRVSLDRARSAPESAVRDRLATIESVEVEGTVLRIHTRVPDPSLLERLADVLIAPERATATLAQKPVGTGPYQFVRGSEARIEARAFPGCWRGRPRIELAEFLSLDGGAALQALSRGEVDVLRWVPEARVAEFQALPGIRVVGRHGLRALYLWMNSEKQGSVRNPFADKRVRRALSFAIDRDALIAGLGGRGTSLERFFPQAVLGHVSGSGALAFDPSRSRSLLREAGYPDGFKTELVAASGAEPVVALIVPMLGSVGVEVQPKSTTWTQMLPLWQTAHLPFFLGSWWFSSGDASLFLKECLGTRPRDATTGWNPGYSDPALDRLVDEDFRIFGDPKRFKHLELLTEFLLEAMPLVPLVSRDDVYAVRGPVQWEPRVDGRLLATEMAWE